MVVEAFVPSLNQSIETAIEEVRIQVVEPLNDGFLNFGRCSERRLGRCSFNSLNPARVRIQVPQKLELIFIHEIRMKSSLCQQKFQEKDTLGSVINYQQRKELIFSRKIHPGTRNRLSLACVE
ncbi:hypothetical protein AVEN_189139-1 [Araneus ventricosus]|uniref:Uncharacterized protein n=1 Tax=Araneus ventricosus TaxID=182803 RepID=A0A4Y2JTP9_ARAVE|nr:hypothetical protein AVEN_189139-1 [Araneus ventricosus]